MKALNKKLIIGTVLMCSMMSASAVTPAVAANYTTPSIVIDSRTISSDTDPFIIDGTTLVPLRVISENLGASVDWDATTRTVTVTKGNTTIQLTVDEYLARINGEAVTISMSPRIINNRTMVPLRFIGETFDCQVGWDGETKTVTITTNGEVAPPFEQAQVDSFGRAIRTTNLPSNASMFPYIAEGVPNWCYEQQEKIWYNNAWGPNYYSDNSGKATSNLKMTDMYQDEAVYKENGNKPSPKGLAVYGSSYFPQTLGNGTYELVDKFIDAQTNIDYNTIGEDFINTMNECVNLKSFEHTKYAILKDYSEAYIKYVKDNKFVSSCEYEILPETMWADMNNRIHFSVYMKFTPVSGNGNPDDAIWGGFAAWTLKSNPGKPLEYGKTYEGVVTYTLSPNNNADTENWKIDFDWSDISVQLNPTIDATDAVPPSQTRKDRIQKFGYYGVLGMTSEQTLLWDRYSPQVVTDKNDPAIRPNSEFN